MKLPPFEPRRWSDHPSDGDVPTSRAADDLRRVRETPPVRVDCLERAWTKIDENEREAWLPSILGWRTWRLAPVLVIVFLAASGAVVAATGMLRLHRKPAIEPLPVEPDKSLPLRRTRHASPPRIARQTALPDEAALSPNGSGEGTPPAPTAGPVGAAPFPEPTRAEPRTGARAPARRLPAAAPVPDHELLEAQAVGAALRQLRKQNDASGALARLDQHATRFADGQLATEVSLIRVEALLALGRRMEARRTLDGLALRAMPRARELLVLRGELRAEARDCALAATDFSAALSASPHDPIDERALRGRAACRAQDGKPDDARADLERYLERFPSGTYAADARAALGAR